MVDPLDAVSPLDGRYAEQTAPLREYGSEGALARARVRVEIEYLLALEALDVTSLSLSEADRKSLRSVVSSFGLDAARRIKTLEVEGDDQRDPTHHDVKAVEYYVRDQVPSDAQAWVHFGLTSEDVNNLARRLLIRDAIQEILLPTAQSVRDALVSLAHDSRSMPMLARTHGQRASPTTFGKEMAVFASRTARAVTGVRDADAALEGKLAGATGTYAAHKVAVPDIDWRAFAKTFVEDLGFTHIEPVTQVNPGDDIARLFNAIQRLNGVFLDCARDLWQYISDGYLQPVDTSGVGSSTMPHKVNPIRFENAEGNLEKASADLRFLSRYLQTSRLQRDLSDSTVKRTISPAFGHCLLAYENLETGLTTIQPNEAAMTADLEAAGEVLTEALQTVLRRTGREDAYEAVAAATQGDALTLAEFRDIVQSFELPQTDLDRLLELTPAAYTGLATELAMTTDNE